MSKANVHAMPFMVVSASIFATRQACPSTFSSAEIGTQVRTRLIERLNERVRVSAGSTQGVTLVSVPAGFGKSRTYSLFYQSKLMPRWLSVWGLIGAMLYLTQGLLAMFSVDFSIVEAPLAL